MTRTRQLPAGKPPKLRYQPGTFLKYEGQLYEIVNAFRVRDDPNEWRYTLEERKSLKSVEDDDVIGHLALALDAVSGKEKPARVQYAPFHTGYDAVCFFLPYPASGDQRVVTNKRLIQYGELVSSGEINDT